MPESNTNPFTGTPYHSWADVEADLKDHPECKAKIYNIWKRIQKLLDHEGIRNLCGILGSATPEETWRLMNALSDKELGDLVDRAMKKKRKRDLANYAYLETQGLVPAYSGAGVA